MVERIFEGLGKPPRIVSIPPGLFRLALSAASFLPRYRHLTPAMADRVADDLVVPHDEAVRDFGYHPAPRFLQVYSRKRGLFSP